MTRSVSTGPPRLTPLRELQLLEQHRQGDPKALSELLTTYQRRMYTICYRMFGRESDASDATQDAILKVISGLDSYDGRSQLSTWVFRITLNCCYDQLRTAKRHQHAPLSAAVREAETRENLHAGAHHREPSGLANVQQHEAKEALMKALGSLDAELRAILVLRDVQDLDYQQVAEVLEIPLGTVKSRLFRARNVLREILEREGEREERGGSASGGATEGVSGGVSGGGLDGNARSA